MPTISVITFDVQLQRTGNTLTVVMHDLSVYPNGALGIYTITEPDGYVRQGDWNSPDVVSVLAGTTDFYFTINNLRLSSTNEIQNGTYTFNLKIKTTDNVITSFTRTAVVGFKRPSHSLREEFDVFTPSLKYYDDTNYQASNFNIVTTSRQWVASSTAFGTTIEPTTSMLDLVYLGDYYDATYNISIDTNMEYQHQVYAWLSLTDVVSSNISTFAQSPPTILQFVSLISQLRTLQESLTNYYLPYKNVKADFEYAQALFMHILDKIKNADMGSIYVDLKELIYVLHNNHIPTYTATNLPIGAYDLSSAGGGAWGTITGTITNQTDLVNYITSRITANNSIYDSDLDGTVDEAEKMVTWGRNSTGATLYKGTIVYILGSTGNRPNFVKAQANSEATSAGTFGVVIADMANNTDGKVATIGTLHNLDTRSNATNPFTDVTLADGDTLYLHPTVAGYVTNVKPSAPNHIVYVGKAVRTHPSLGTIVYRIQNGYEISEIHDVSITSPSNGQVLQYNSSTGLWNNATISTSNIYTADGTLTGNRTVTMPGTNTLTFSGSTSATQFIVNTRSQFNGSLSLYDTLSFVGSTSASKTIYANQLTFTTNNAPNYSSDQIKYTITTDSPTINSGAFTSTLLKLLMPVNTGTQAGNSKALVIDFNVITNAGVLTALETVRGNLLLNSTSDNTYIGHSTAPGSPAKLDVNGAIKSRLSGAGNFIEGVYNGTTTFYVSQAGFGYFNNAIQTPALQFFDQGFVSASSDGFTAASSYNQANNKTLTFRGDLRFGWQSAINSVFYFGAWYGLNGTYGDVGNIIAIGTPNGNAIGRATGTGSHNIINVNPTYNFTGTSTATIRGLYYNPTLTSMTGVTHRAIELATGDILLDKGIFQKNLYTDTSLGTVNFKIGTGYELYGTLHSAGGFETFLTTSGFASGFSIVIGNSTNKAAVFNTGNVTLNQPLIAASGISNVTGGSNLSTFSVSPNTGFKYNTTNGWTFAIRNSADADVLSCWNDSNVGIGYSAPPGTVSKFNVNGSVRIVNDLYTDNGSISILTISGNRSFNSYNGIIIQNSNPSFPNDMLSVGANNGYFRSGGAIRIAPSTLAASQGVEFTAQATAPSFTMIKFIRNRNDGVKSAFICTEDFTVSTATPVHLYIYAGKETTASLNGDLILQHDGTTNRGSVGIGVSSITSGIKFEVSGKTKAVASSLSGASFICTTTQTQLNSTDTSDAAMQVAYALSGSGAGTQLVTRVFQLSNDHAYTSATVSNFRVFNLSSSTQTSTTVTDLDQIYIERGTANGTVTRNRGVFVNNLQGTTQIAFAVNAFGGSNNVGLLIGGTTNPSGNWGVYSSDVNYNNAFAGGVVVGTTTIAASAILQSDSTTKGFLPPRMTGAQVEAIASPATGLIAYATSAGAGAVTSTGWWGYNGTTWVRLN